MKNKIENFVDKHVDLKYHTREEAIVLFSYIALLFSQGKESEIEKNFIK